MYTDLCNDYLFPVLNIFNWRKISPENADQAEKRYKYICN